MGNIIIAYLSLSNWLYAVNRENPDLLSGCLVPPCYELETTPPGNTEERRISCNGKGPSMDSFWYSNEVHYKFTPCLLQFFIIMLKLFQNFYFSYSVSLMFQQSNYKPEASSVAVGLTSFRSYILEVRRAIWWQQLFLWFLKNQNNLILAIGLIPLRSVF